MARSIATEDMHDHFNGAYAAALETQSRIMGISGCNRRSGMVIDHEEIEDIQRDARILARRLDRMHHDFANNNGTG